MNVHSLSTPLPRFWGAQAASLSHLAACRMHFCSGVWFGSAGSRQAAANYRPAACAPQITLSALPITARVRLVRQILNLSWFGDQYCRQLVLLMGKLKNRNHDAQDQERVNDCFHYPPALFFRADQEPICRLSFVIHNFTTKTLPCSDFV